MRETTGLSGPLVDQVSTAGSIEIWCNVFLFCFFFLLPLSPLLSLNEYVGRDAAQFMPMVTNYTIGM